MKFEHLVSIGYRDIFDDYDQVRIEDLVRDIPTINALEIISYFLVQLHSLERDSSIQIEFLRIWLSRLPQDIHQRINDFIKRINSNPRAQYNFLNNVSGLFLIETLLQNLNKLEQLDNLSPDQELKLFKAYLLCSQKWIDKQTSKITVGKISKEEDLIKILIPAQLPMQEILEFKDFSLQILKAVYFFKFCETDTQFSNYLQIFLNEYNLDSWQRYLLNLLKLYTRKFERLVTPFRIEVPEGYPDALSFLRLLSIDANSFNKSDDFLSLRERPIYQINQSKFIILNLNFLVDKLYQGIQFDLARVLVKNSAIFNGKKIKNTVDFMSIFGKHFSETGLFCNIMDYVFEKTNYKKLRASEIQVYIHDGEPDYYMRDKSKVYLFEFKNVYISSVVKNSGDYTQICSEIFKKLVSNQEGDAKGVSQLINSIKKIRNGEFNKFDDYDFNNVIIYPIIVYIDFSFNISGINYILNQEFRKKIDDSIIINSENIKDLVLIDLDSLIKFQDLFRDKTLKINNCLNEYYDLIKKTRDIYLRITTFNIHIHNKTSKLHYGLPKMLQDEVLKMMPFVQT
jgi:hypothetical protein